MFKESGNMGEDGEVVMCVFDPVSLKVEDAYGYKLPQLREGREDNHPGAKKYRSITVVKNSYGSSDVGCGLAFQPETGIFQELPYPNQMTDEIYNQIRNDSYFLKNRK